MPRNLSINPLHLQKNEQFQADAAAAGSDC